MALLDHDDAMLPRRLERQLVFMREHPDVPAFASRAEYINAAGVVFGETIPPPIFTREQFEAFHGAGEIIWFCHPAAMLHRATVLSIGGYRTDLRVAQPLNLPLEEWPSVFGSERLTGALLDRLTHHVHILEMDGEVLNDSLHDHLPE